MRNALIGLILAGCSAAPIVPSATRATGLELEPIGGLGLFADERARAHVMLSDALSSLDAGLIPLEVTAQAWALAAEGRNPFTGAVCGKSLSPHEARKRWGSALGVTGTVSTHVWCAADGGCELSVYGRPLDDDANDRFTLVAPVPRTGEALTAFASAVTNLAPPAPSEGSGGILGGMGGSSPVQEEDRLDVRIWHADNRERTQLDDTKDGFPSLTVGQVQACLTGTDSALQVQIEVTNTGLVSRCEGEPSEEPRGAKCVCEQLQRIPPAGWLAGRRWGVTLRVDRRDQLTGDRRFVLSGSWNTYLSRVQVPGEKYPRFKPKVEDPSIDSWTPGSSRLAIGCFANAFTAAGHVNSRWAVWFDGAGQPTKVLEQKGFPPLSKELKECVSVALRTAQSPCPSRAGLWAMADLRVSARDPNAPPATFKDLLESR